MPGMAISPRDAVIVDGLRTPVGKLRGALGSVRPDDLGGQAIRRLLARPRAPVQRAIRVGEADLIVAGGVESMTRAPWSVAKPSEAFPSGSPQSFDTALGWRF